MAVPAAVLSILVQANTGGATRGLMRFNQQLGATEAKSSRALGAVKTMAKGSAIATGIGLGYAVKKAADFEQQLDSLGSVSDASGKQMDQFRKQAMKAGADTKFSALDAAVAQTELAKGGLKVRQIMRGGLAAALSLAAAGEMELGEAAATTANALNLFGLEGKSSMKVADALAKAANATTADVTDFAMALRQSGGVAKTAGLSFTETVLALEALANAGTKNSDAGTSLKTALLQLIGPTEKQQKLQDKLGLSFIDSSGGMKSMTQISTMLRGALDGMGAAQRAATLKVLAGTDGVRTLTALYDAGPEKLDKWRRGLNESGTAADVAAQKQDNLKGKLENLQGSVETIAIGLGSKLLPSLTKFAEKTTAILNDPKLTGGEKFSRFMELVTQAVEKAIPVMAAAGVKIAGALAAGLARGWREMNPLMKLFTAAAVIRLVGGRGALLKSGLAIGTTLGAGISAGAAGAAAGGAGAAGAAAAGGGMLAAMRAKVLPVAKRLGLAGVGIALADVVISEFGRRSAAKGGDMFKALEAQAGPKPGGLDIFGGETKLLGIEGPNLLGDKMLKDSEQAARKLLPALQDIQKAQRGIGHEKAEALRKEIGRLDEATPQARQALRELVGGFERTGRRAKELESSIARMKKGSVLSVRELRQVTSNNMKIIAQDLGAKSKAGNDAVRKNFKAGISAVKTLMQSGQISTGRAAKEISRLLKVHSGAGKEALKANFRQAREFIAATMRNSKGITAQGMAAIRGIFAQELKLYGLSKEAIKFRLQGKEQSGKTIAAPLVNKQRGGPIMQGAPSGDTVPAMLERGEYVVNRKAVKKVGRRALDQINFAQAPRFQEGGMVRIPGDPNLTGGRDLVNKSVRDLAAFLVKLGNMEVGYAFDPGGGHKSPGHNVTGTALDAYPAGNDPGWKRLEKAIRWATNRGMTVYYDGQAGSTPLADHGEGNHAHFELASGNPGSKFPAVSGPGRAPKIKRQVVTGGEDSPLRAAVQHSLDATREGALGRLKKLSKPMRVAGSDPGGMPGGFTGGGTPSQNRKLGIKMAKARGWGGAQFRALDKLWQGESGWDEGVANYQGSGAYGIAQALPASKYPPAGQPSAPNGPAKAQAQIKWGLDYIAERYTNPVGAYKFWLAQSPHWYQKGGLIQQLMAGGPVRSYPLAKKASVIGTPYSGTHSLGNWESDNAVDLGVPIGTVVKALTDGKISKIAGGWDGGGGRTSGIQVHFDNENTSWFYTHLKKMNASVGQKLAAGQNFGLSGAGNGVPHLHLGRENGSPMQVLNWPIASASSGPGGGSSSGDGGGGGGKGTSGDGGPIKKLAYVGDSLGVGTLGAGLKAKLGKIKLASSVLGGKTSSWGVNALKGLLDKDVGAAMLDMGTNDGTAGNLRPSIDAVEGMLKGRPLMMASLDPQSTDVAKKNAAIRSNANVVVPWAGIAQKYASDKVHPTGAGYSKRASLIASAAKRLRTGGKDDSGLTDSEKKQMKTPLKGSLGKVLTKTLKVLRSNKPAKFRGSRLKQLEKRIKGMDVGLPEGMRKQITGLRASIEEVGEYADRASSLSVDNEDGTTSLGVIKGKTEAGWLTDQLDMLFRLRNKLVDAKATLEKHRAEIQKLVERMQKRLKELSENIRAGAEAKNTAERELKQLQKHPKQNKEAIERHKATIERIDGLQSDRVRERDAISDKIIPALVGKRKQFTTFINETIMGSDGLPQIQGLGSPLEKLTELPAIGVLGGDIFDTQLRLRELAAPATSITDGSSSEASESAELLRQLLDEANLRTAVSQKQYEVLRNMPPYGGQFATGGVVPGPIGAARTIVAHGGETVTPPGNGAPVNVQVSLGSGMEWLDKYIEVKVDGVTRKQARAGARGLPGRGGGI